MNHIQEMLRSHPRAGDVDGRLLEEMISALYNCAQSCTTCADACLGEEMVAELVRCIRLNLDCADVCETTGALLSRQTEPDWSLISEQLRACATACRVCGEECERHADMHEHCRICAESCRHCEEMCQRMLQAIPSGATA
ncbi:MAG TPA: four-helix bundle copper-binding protein [Candidatus Sulfomarinibacteraceae bacterium]|nr:four-helix bundle copper-binding protein [Candidatus Sulfomarinibacteraceae bacterium]